MNTQHSVIIFMKNTSIALSLLLSSGILARTYKCSSTEDIVNAMENVKPGDEILIKPGRYIGKRIYNSAYFFSETNGTKSNPIIIRSIANDTKVILEGRDINSATILRIKGDFWVIQGISFTNAKKGIVLDNSDNSIIKSCSVFNIANEAIHIRDNSNNTIIDGCKIYNTGVINAGFGEGIYIGSDKGAWNRYSHKADNSVIKNCIIGPNVRAEGVDIKEGTQGTLLKNNQFLGKGISGENSAKSFISVKGINNTIFSNTFDAMNDSIIKSGITFLNRGTKLSGYDNYVFDNTFRMSDSDSYVIKANKGTSRIYAMHNSRIPKGKNGTRNVIKAYPKNYSTKNRYIILKLDDLKPSKSKCYNENWQKLVNTVRDLNIKASLGIIPQRLKSASTSCKDSIKKWHKSSQFEIWHHGWNHKRKNYGKLKDNIGEFSGTPYNYQKDNFEKAIEVVKIELGIVMLTFGAPYNKTDSIFSRVIRENKDVKVWFYPNDKKPFNGLKLYRGEKNKLESKTGFVSFKKFLEAYENSNKEYLVLQGHPGKWDESSFKEFYKVVKFLKEKNAIFMLPRTYYDLTNPN